MSANDSYKKWIVLDIDGTLSMTIDPEEYHDLDNNTKKYFNKITYHPFENKDFTKDAWVMSRPYLKVFLDYCFEHYRVGVWSIGQPGYVNAIVKHLFEGYEPEFVYNFTNCHRESNPVRFLKRLSDSPAMDGLIIEDSIEVIDIKDKHVIIQRFDMYLPDSTDLSDPFDSDEVDDIMDFDILLYDDCLLKIIDILNKMDRKN